MRENKVCFLHLRLTSFITFLFTQPLPVLLALLAIGKFIHICYPKMWMPIKEKIYLTWPEPLINIFNSFLKFYNSTSFTILAIIGTLSLIYIFCEAIYDIKHSFNPDRQNRQTNESTELDRITEAPIQTLKQDRFFHKSYVMMLNNLINSIATNEACYIGVYGKWGEGKTSALNLLKEHVSQDKESKVDLFIHFSPWEFPEGSDYRSLLFEEISRSIAQQPKKRDLARIFSKLAFGFKLQRIQQHIGSIHNVIDMIRTLWFNLFFTTEDLFRCTKKELTRLNKRIGVVIDDLDRLSQEEICQVIRFLKANGDLPNLVYLVLADIVCLADALKDFPGTNGDGKEYLEKIIPYSCPLLPLSAEIKRKYLKEEIVRLILTFNLPDFNLEKEYDQVLERATTPRKLNRIIIAFSMALAWLKLPIPNLRYLNVHLGDLLLLTLLKAFEIDCYNHLYDTIEEIRKKSASGYLNTNKGVPTNWLDEHFLKYAKNPNWVLSFLQNNLGLTAQYDSSSGEEIAYYYFKDWTSSAARKEYRLASDFYYPNYFFVRNEKKQLQQDTLKEFEEKIAALQDTQELLMKLDADGVLPQLLDVLEVQEPFKTRQITEFFLTQLIELSNKPLNNIQYSSIVTDFDLIFRRTIYEQIFIVIIRYRSNYYSKKENYSEPRTVFGDKILLPLLETIETVVLLYYFVYHEDGHHAGNKADFEAIFSNEGYQSICDLFCQRLIKLQQQDQLFNHPECDNFLWAWPIIIINRVKNLRKDAQKACLPVLDNYGQIKKVCKAFYRKSASSMDEDNPVFVWWLENLGALFDDDGIEKIADILDQEKIMEVESPKMAELLRWALLQKKNSEAYDDKAQYAHVMELRDKTVDPSE